MKFAHSREGCSWYISFTSETKWTGFDRLRMWETTQYVCQRI